jgi:polyhydroxyalkanoate synthase
MVNIFDPFGVAQATLDLLEAAARDPETLIEQQASYGHKWLDLMEQSAAAFAGQTHADVVAPEAGDRRFSHEAWTANPGLDSIKQAYLLATEAIVAGIDATQDVDPKLKRRVRFWAKQFTDAASPANVAWLNPAVIDETVRTGGQNLVRGMQNLLDDLRENEGRVRLVDRKAFTIGKNVATTPGKVVYRNELIELIQYAPTTPSVAQRPIVIVPPWINKYYVLDLQPANSVVKYLTDSGFTTFIISWRNPDASMAEYGMDEYRRLGPEAAFRVAAEIAGTPDVNALGYCLGGTLLSIELAYLAAKGDALVNAATYFAALVDFEEPGEVTNFLSPEGLAFVEEKMREQGVLDGRVMGDAFNLLRANDLIWNVAVSRYLLGKDAPAFDLLYWNDDATRMPCAMHSYYLENMYAKNRLVQPNALEMEGTPIDVGRIANDAYVVATAEDHIAPWKSVYHYTHLTKGDVRFRLGHSGHIAGIINAPGKKKGNYWANDGANPADPEAWLAGAQRIEGSWWPDWVAWLGQRSGPQVAPRTPGDGAHPALADAPGSYVLEK